MVLYLRLYILGAMSQITSSKFQISIRQSTVLHLATKSQYLKPIVLRKVLILGFLVSPKFS